jgi:amphi-Trp domain-containing protein
MADELIEVETEVKVTREEAAARLRALADQLSKQNQVTFEREGLRYTVKVPTNVELSVEIEIGDEGGEIEIELSW